MISNIENLVNQFWASSKLSSNFQGTYWFRHFEFRKSDSKILNTCILILNKIIAFANFWTPYWIRDFEFREFRNLVSRPRKTLHNNFHQNLSFLQIKKRGCTPKANIQCRKSLIYILRVKSLCYMLLHRTFEFIYELYIRDRGISIEIRFEIQRTHPL